MDPSRPVITLSHVGKEYGLYDSVGQRLQSALFPKRRTARTFKALDNISLTLNRGEFLGIIGRNGSGKSTLLELICGISRPSSGELSVEGKVSALLELGAGFNPELSGRDNVYLNGNILGLSNALIDSYFRKISDFADIGEFMDKPVKIYSSGMYVRLAFAVQACIDPDILIVDEALAVGDIFFRQKCYQYINRLIENGTTVILVTHSMGDIEQFCSRVLLLESGRAAFLGDPSEAVKRYYLLNQPNRPECAPDRVTANIQKEAGSQLWPEEVTGFEAPYESQVTQGEANCTRFAVLNTVNETSYSFSHGSIMVILAEFVVHKDLPVPVFGAEIINDRGIIVHGKTSLETNTPVPEFIAAGTKIVFRQEIGLRLAPGEYTLTMGMSCLPNDAYRNRHGTMHEDLYANIIRLCNLQKFSIFSVFFPIEVNDVHLKHHGIADLPGTCAAQLVAHEDN